MAVAEFSSNICERFMKFLGIPLSSYFTPKVCLLLEQCFSVLDPETLEETIESGPLCITGLRLAYKKKTKK